MYVSRLVTEAQVKTLYIQWDLTDILWHDFQQLFYLAVVVSVHEGKEIKFHIWRYHKGSPCLCWWRAFGHIEREKNSKKKKCVLPGC